MSNQLLHTLEAVDWAEAMAEGSEEVDSVEAETVAAKAAEDWMAAARVAVMAADWAMGWPTAGSTTQR